MPIGSPAYMAPEQAAGRIREHGPATDVYSLGVILYELLTGTPPHRGETDLETLRLVSDQDPPSPGVLRPGIPRDLETILLKCLEKRPPRRYASAADLSLDLQRFLEGKPVKARPVPPWEQAAKWARRRPLHAALALVLGASVLTITVGLEWARVREKRHVNQIRAADARLRKSETEARDQRALAERERLRTYQHQYATQLKLAGSLAERKENEPAMQILETLRTLEGLPETHGFAWRYLDRKVRPPVTRLPAISDLVNGGVYSPDGRIIALADFAGNTFLIDASSGALRELKGRRKFIYCPRLVFSPDGRTLASISSPVGRRESEVHLWDVETGTSFEEMPQNHGYCFQIVFSPDGSTLITIESAPMATVHCWMLSEDRKRVTLGEKINADALTSQLSHGLRMADSSGGVFRLSDLLAVTPDDRKTMAVVLENDEIRVYKDSSGYLDAVCRLQGDEVVYVPRTDSAVPLSHAEVEQIGCAALSLSAPLARDRSTKILLSSPLGSPAMLAPPPLWTGIRITMPAYCV